mgnify:CR=1 FL=1
MKITDFDVNDFNIKVRPMQYEDGTWTGEIDVTVIASPDNDMQDDDYEEVMYFCKMIASTVPIMENNKELRELVHRYVKKFVDPNSNLEFPSDEECVTKEGNVIRIDFSKGKERLQ